jgi:hypothetical protein
LDAKEVAGRKIVAFVDLGFDDLKLSELIRQGCTRFVVAK